MSRRIRSPRIQRVEWGIVEAEGIPRTKDLKLFPGGGRAWDWNETGTRHVPGIQPEDILELLEHGSTVIVLSRGMQLVLQTSQEALDFLKAHNIPVHIEETTRAVEIYNKLSATEDVGGLFHSTC